MADSFAPTTPPATHSSLSANPTEETPRSARATATTEHQTKLRPEIAREMKNKIVSCPVDNFVNHYLPFAPVEADVAAGRAMLIAEGHLSEDNKWAKFLQSPSSQPAHENDVFKPIGEIAQSLAELKLTSSILGSAKTSQWMYYATPNARIVGETEGGNHIVDGTLCPQVIQGSETHTSDLALVFEYKKKSDNKSVTRNRHQVVSAANYIMNDDPRRLFTYGITIEDGLVSVWYFSRSHSAKSEEFNFLENPDLLITILISFLFATEQAIGFDPNVHRRRVAPGENRKITYIYKLVDENATGDNKVRYFETQGTISKPRRACITGRATQTVKAKEVSSEFREPPTYKENAPTVFLRDVWLDEGALTEREIQTAIFEDLEAFARNLPSDGSSPHFTDFDDDMKAEILDLLKDEKYRAYFLTISCESVGFKSKDVHPNAVADPMLLSVSESQPRSMRRAEGANSNSDSFTTQSTPTTNAPVRDYKPKQSYRLIYEECCVDLYSKELTSIHEAFVALEDALTALTLLFCAGWVHRDISSGNVLLWRDSDGGLQGKLGDLEYAKRFPSNTGSSDPKTGTAYFMPVEVARNSYIPAPLKWGARPAVLSPVQHNFRHDLESLWWLTLWIVTYRVGNLKLMEKMKIFVTDMQAGPAARYILLREAAQLGTVLQDLHPSLQNFSSSLEMICILLWMSYSEQTESGKRTAIATYSGMYKAMRQMLSTTIVGVAPPMMNGQYAISRAPVMDPILPHYQVDWWNRLPDIEEWIEDIDHLMTVFKNSADELPNLRAGMGNEEDDADRMDLPSLKKTRLHETLDGARFFRNGLRQEMTNEKARLGPIEAELDQLQAPRTFKPYEAAVVEGELKARKALDKL